MVRLSLALLACCFLAVPASATLIITTATGNCLISGCENILFQADDIGTTIVGVSNNGNTNVEFTAGGLTLLAPANGQARIEQQEANFSSLSFITPGFFFGEVLFNINAASGDPDDTATIKAVDNEGQTFEETFGLGNGENRIRVQGTDGETIASVEIGINNGSMLDVRQFRIGGFTAGDEPGDAPVPEPSSMTMFGLGLGAITFGLRKSRDSRKS